MGKGNKDSDSNKNDIGSHIRSLKDVRELELTENPTLRHKDGRKSDAIVGDGGHNDLLKSRWVCPIAGLEMNGKFKFVFDWGKGRVLSERGHKIVMKNDPEMKISSEDLVVINAEEKEEEESMLANMETRRAKAKAEKASKKSTKTVLQNDPSKSEVYKSLFSSHKSAVNKPKGNWVTFDPRYN